MQNVIKHHMLYLHIERYLMFLVLLLSTDRPKGTRRLKNTDLLLDAQSQPQTLPGSRDKLEEQ